MRYTNPHLPVNRALTLAQKKLGRRGADALALYQHAYRSEIEPILRGAAKAEAKRRGFQVVGAEDVTEAAADLDPARALDYQSKEFRLVRLVESTVAFGQSQGEDAKRQRTAAATIAAAGASILGLPASRFNIWAHSREAHEAAGVSGSAQEDEFARTARALYALFTKPGSPDDRLQKYLDIAAEILGRQEAMKQLAAEGAGPAETITYAGVDAAVTGREQVGELVAYHALGSYRPAIITELGKMGRKGRELTAEGWGPVKSLTGPWNPDDKPRGNRLAVMPWRAVFRDPDVVSDLAAVQGRYQQEVARKEAEAEAKKREAERRRAEIGPWFADLEDEVAKEAGMRDHYSIPDTVEAATIRKVLRSHGIKAKVTVRRYSMASGLNVDGLSASEAKTAGRIFPGTERAFASGMGIYPSQREDRSDWQTDYHDPGGFRVALPYVAEVKAALAEEFAKYLAKSQAKESKDAKPVEVDVKPGDMVILFGRYEGSGIDVLYVKQPSWSLDEWGAPFRGGLGIAAPTIANSHVFRRKRTLGVYTDKLAKSGAPVETLPTAKIEKGVAMTEAAGFTPRRLQKAPAAGLVKAMTDAGFRLRPGQRVLWASAREIAHYDHPTKTYSLRAMEVPGASIVQGKAAPAPKAPAPPKPKAPTAAPAAGGNPVDGLPGWTLRYVQAPKGSAPWWNVGVLDDRGKKLRYGYNPDEDRWARGQVPPVRVIQAAMVEGLPFSSASPPEPGSMSRRAAAEERAATEGADTVFAERDRADAAMRERYRKAYEKARGTWAEYQLRGLPDPKGSAWIVDYTGRDLQRITERAEAAADPDVVPRKVRLDVPPRGAPESTVQKHASTRYVVTAREAGAGNPEFWIAYLTRPSWRRFREWINAAKSKTGQTVAERLVELAGADEFVAVREGVMRSGHKRAVAARLGALEIIWTGMTERQEDMTGPYPSIFEVRAGT